MTLRDVDKANADRLEARESVFYAAEAVGHGRHNGTLTTDQLDKLRDAVLEYDRAVRRYLHA